MSDEEQRSIAGGTESDEREESYIGLQAFYLQTGNPIAAWAAIFSWSLKYEENPKSHIMPKPLLDFLTLNSLAIMELAEGHKPPVFRDGKLASHKEPNAISPSQAFDFLPEALRLRGYKWNAFADASRSMESADLFNHYQAARRMGISAGEAMETLSKLSGVTDPRTLRRKLKGGRGPRQKSPYPVSGSITEGYVIPQSAAKKPKATGAKKP